MKGCILRGDLGKITLQQNVIVGRNTILRPYFLEQKGSYRVLRVGEYVVIGHNCVVEASEIDAYVWIGDHCVIGNRAAIGSSVVLLPGTVVPPDADLPPFAVYGGNPARLLHPIPECYAHVIRAAVVHVQDLIESGQMPAL
eukprot:TRINITY_DN3165_c0_g1_i1.p2 TRINITY_DN3165_c0_g1~~TRINITY_DN3165_c0_g1_i1.p2  ORF type:complete len:141 (+),score=35.60 TRINITY_DN3165_c0_g1_i1:186-608(+)